MVEVLFLTHNRREYARAALNALLDNTNWSLVDKLWLFDDRSTDGTREMLGEVAPSGMAREIHFVSGCWESPVTAMADFFRRAKAPLVAKIDSDTMLPPLWLDECVNLLARNERVSLLGIEDRGDGTASADRTCNPSEWIGGIGVFRRAAFRTLPERNPVSAKWFGWQDWQKRYGIPAAWIKPSLQVFLLDRMPLEPWKSLSEEYAAKGWQRERPWIYSEDSTLWDWWEPARIAAASPTRHRPFWAEQTK